MVCAGRALVNTAACISRYCGNCPAPVLRRKCDTYCPHEANLHGLYRVDLASFVAPGATWAQWISSNDAALTPCRLIRFGTDPADCYVLDRNCSRCFFPVGCTYNLDINLLPVATFQNPILATCDNCIACEQCCDSATFIECETGRSVCHECGSSYKTSAIIHSHSTFYTRTSSGAMILNEELTRDHTLDSSHECLPINGQCNTTAMRWTNTGTLRVQGRKLTATVPDLVYVNLDETRLQGTDYPDPENGPNHCGHITSVRQAIGYLELGAGWTGPLTRAGLLAALPRFNTGTSGLVAAKGPALDRECSGSFLVRFGQFSGLYTNEQFYTWRVTVGEYGATVSLTYSAQVYTIQGTTRILQNDTQTQAAMTYRIQRINDCSATAPMNCRDRLDWAGGAGAANSNGSNDSPIFPRPGEIRMNPNMAPARQSTNPMFGESNSTGAMF